MCVCVAPFAMERVTPSPRQCWASSPRSAARGLRAAVTSPRCQLLLPTFTLKNTLLPLMSLPGSRQEVCLHAWEASALGQRPATLCVVVKTHRTRMHAARLGAPLVFQHPCTSLVQTEDPVPPPASVVFPRPLFLHARYCTVFSVGVTRLCVALRTSHIVQVSTLALLGRCVNKRNEWR